MSFESCEWFNKEKIKISQNIPYFDVIKENFNTSFFNDIIHYKSDDFITPTNIKFNKLKTVDYDKKYDNLLNSKEKLLDNIKFNKESTKKGTITKINKKLDNYNKIIKARCFQIYPNSEQKQILFNWMNECTKLYNYCVKIYNEDSTQFNLNYTKMKLIIFNNLYGETIKPAPYDILTDEVRSFCSNIKSCLTNLKNNNINHFKITNKNVYQSQSILIPTKSINNKGIFTSLLKQMNGFDKININDIKGDCRLIYDHYFNKFYLKCPMYFDIKNIDKRNKIVALDPGEKIFMTYYSFNNCGMIGYDIKNKILLYESKIRKIQRIIANKKIKNRKRLKIRLRKYYKKIKNIVKELHNKTALYLVKNYDKILLPSFETSYMIKCFGKKYIKQKLEELKDTSSEEKRNEIKKIFKKKRLSKRVKFVLNNLSHYKFKQHLKHKCEEYGCELQIVTEEYTSRCCTNCSIQSDNYRKRQKICHNCNLCIDRDVNGSRNILIKNSEGNYKIRS